MSLGGCYLFIINNSSLANPHVIRGIWVKSRLICDYLRVILNILLHGTFVACPHVLILNSVSSKPVGITLTHLLRHRYVTSCSHYDGLSVPLPVANGKDSQFLSDNRVCDMFDRTICELWCLSSPL